MKRRSERKISTTKAVRGQLIRTDEQSSSILDLADRAAALVPPVRFVPDDIKKMAGEGIAWKTTCFHEVVSKD